MSSEGSQEEDAEEKKPFQQNRKISTKIIISNDFDEVVSYTGQEGNETSNLSTRKGRKMSSNFLSVGGRHKRSTSEEFRKVSNISTRSAPYVFNPRTLNRVEESQKERSLSIGGQQQQPNVFLSSTQNKLRERKNGVSRQYIQTDNPFVVVKRRENSFSDVNNNSNSNNNIASNSNNSNSQEEEEEEEKKIGVISELRSELSPSKGVIRDKTRSHSQANLTPIKIRTGDFPKRLVRQRSNTIIGRLPVFHEDEEDERLVGDDYELVDVRSEIFRIKDQFDDLLDVLDGRLFGEIKSASLLKKRM